MEGDTPSFLYLLQNGLYTDAADRLMSGGKLHISSQATIWRWRDTFQNDG